MRLMIEKAARETRDIIYTSILVILTSSYIILFSQKCEEAACLHIRKSLKQILINAFEDFLAGAEMHGKQDK